MKKIIAIIAVFISFSANAQTISITLQSFDIGWLIGKNITTIRGTDSASKKALRNIRDQIIAINPTSRTQSITLNNVPVKVGEVFYQTIVKNAGEMVTRYTAITNELKSKPALSAFIAAYDLVIEADRERSYLEGKSEVMDQ